MQPIDYYIRNKKVSRILMILKTYEFINKNISKQFKSGTKFNPSMLCFSLLSTWFAELSILEDEIEFLYFSRYPYTEIYDVLLLNIENKEYRDLNIAMLHIAENTIYKLNNYKFK